jgi:hypothetical protein
VAVDEEPHVLLRRRRARAFRAARAPRAHLHGGLRGRVLDVVARAVPERVARHHGQTLHLLLLQAGLAAPVRRVQLYKRGQALDQLRLERVHVLVHVAVAVPHDAPVRPVARRADAAHQVPLRREHVRHRHRLHAHEHEHLVERGQVRLTGCIPMCFVSLNPTVTAMQRIMSNQLISGMYIWPWIFSDVCTTFTRGKQLKD